MYDFWMDWNRPRRGYLDPELEYVVATSLIESHPPRRYALAAFEVGQASIIAGGLILLLSAYGSTLWAVSVALEVQQSLFVLAVIGVVLMTVGIALVVVPKLVK